MFPLLPFMRVFWKSCVGTPSPASKGLSVVCFITLLYRGFLNKCIAGKSSLLHFNEYCFIVSKYVIDVYKVSLGYWKEALRVPTDMWRAAFLSLENICSERLHFFTSRSPLQAASAWDRSNSTLDSPMSLYSIFPYNVYSKILVFSSFWFVLMTDTYTFAIFSKDSI